MADVPPMEKVEIEPGVVLPELFKELVSFETDDGRVVVEVVVAVLDGLPRLWSVLLLGKPISELATVTWARLLDAAVAQRLARERIRDSAPGMYELGLGDYTTELDFDTARRTRRRNRVTPELLERAAALYLEDGAQKVADELHVSRRQADRYVKEARELGLLT